MIEITCTQLVSMTEEQVLRYNKQNNVHLFDDNGDVADGDMYLLPVDEIIPFEGMETVQGFSISAYTENANYAEFTGFSSRGVAYTISRDTANAIAADEYVLADLDS